MKTRIVLSILMIALAALLAACSGADAVRDGNAVYIKGAHIRIEFPESFSVVTGKEVYKELYELMSDEYESVKELRKEFEDNGEKVLLQARSENVTVMLMEFEKGEFSISELMQSLHGNSVFDYRASGYFTESTLEETEWGGVSGIMSSIHVYEEKGAPLISEEREFCFERSDKLYSIQLSSAAGLGEQNGGISFGIAD